MIKDLIKTLLESGMPKRELSRQSGIAVANINRILSGNQQDVVYSKGKRLEQIASEVKDKH